MIKPVVLPRRRLLALLPGLAAADIRRPHGPGVVRPPLPMPHVAVTREDGSSADLATMLAGHVTALQFVLTGCSSICPVLGTIFERVQDMLAIHGDSPFQLVSFSLDPVGDTPAAFAAWLAKFGAGRAWHAAIPHTDRAGVAALLQGWGLSSGTSSDYHTDTVLLINRNADLVFRSPDLPDPAPIATLMRQLARGV